ncbi:MAG: ATP-binding protein [bacterium]|nr:ATP-binding protein [bacterium]MDT8395756.1 ATP-binding protein [bacterium]
MSLESLLTDSLLEGLFIFDAEARLVRINPSGERILGRSERTAAGKFAGEIFDSSPGISGLVKAALEEGRAVVQSGLTMPAPDGKKFNLSVSVSPLQDADGTLEGVALLIRDETLLKELDRSQRRADQLATLGILNVGMAHEIKNPLGGIKGATQLLKSEIGEGTRGSSLDEYCDVILREVDRIDSLLDGLLAAVPRGDLRHSGINIHEILNEVVTLLELSGETAGLTFERLYDPSLPHIRGDRNGLTQVFLNLLKNSVEASPPGGQIVVRTLVPVGAPLTAPSAPGNSHRGAFLEVEVEDRGPGFDPGVTEFAAPFFTTKPKGVGLGLVISEQIVQNHGGSLTLDNREGGGAVVRVFLPLNMG